MIGLHRKYRSHGQPRRHLIGLCTMPRTDTVCLISFCMRVNAYEFVCSQVSSVVEL